MRQYRVRHIDFSNPPSSFNLRFGPDGEHVRMESFHERAVGLLHSLGARIGGGAERFIMRDGPHGLSAQPSTDHLNKSSMLMRKTNDNQGKNAPDSRADHGTQTEHPNRASNITNLGTRSNRNSIDR